MEACRIVFLVACLGIIAYKHWRHVANLRSDSHNEVPETPTDETDATNTPERPIKKEKEDLQMTLDSVNSWVNNCDQKAGILLTVVGVAITVIMTSDFLKSLREFFFGPFIEYWTGDEELVFSWSRFTVFLLLLIAAGMLIASCYYLFHAISANIDYKKIRHDNPELAKTSYIFFGSICGMTYEDFKKEEIDYLDDLKSQIFVNSIIATAKFRNYNKGLYWFKSMLIVSGMLFIAIMFMK